MGERPYTTLSGVPVTDSAAPSLTRWIFTIMVGYVFNMILRGETPFQKIMTHGVMATPGVVIDGTVVHAGGVPARGKSSSRNDIKEEHTMFSTALVALDLSPAERPIIDCLPALARWGVRRVVLCHVVRVGYAQGGDLANAQDYNDWLAKCAEPLRAAGMDVAVEIRAGGVIEDEIVAAAAQAQANLIVVGSRGHNVVSRMFLGSVARALLHKATTPVLLEWVEPTAAATQSHCEAVCDDTLRHVVIATDFSVDAATAEHAVVHLAPHARRIDALHVAPGRDSDVWQLSAEATQAALDGLATRIREAGGKGESLRLEGKASQEIARYAETHDVSLIVVGKHGRGRLTEKLIGSTAARLCEIAGRPVLMVP